MNERTVLGFLAAVVFLTGALVEAFAENVDPQVFTILLFLGLALLAVSLALPPRIRR